MIRHADPQLDAAACASIYAPHVDGKGTSFEERPPTAGEFAERIEQISVAHPWLVVERDGLVVGFAYATAHRGRPAYRWSAETSVYLAADAQGQGVGTALYVALFDLLRRQGLHVALAGITLPNEASTRLHRSLGFEQIGVYRRIGFKAGAWRDVAWWQLMLNSDLPASPAEPLGPQRLSAH